MMAEVSPLYGTSLRAQPIAIEAEHGLIGQLLITNAALDQVGFLRPAQFADGANAKIFGAICRRVETGTVADAVTLKAEFEGSGDLDVVGGIAHLAKLMQVACGLPAVRAYGVAIVEAWQRRQLIEVGTSLVDYAFAAKEPPADLVANFASQIDRVLTTSANRRTSVAFDDALAAALNAAESAMQAGGPAGISTGLQAVDEALGGLDRGTMTVFAGRPGMGKTALGTTICINVARAARAKRAAGEKAGGVAVISLEMTATELARRALAAAAQVPVQRIKAGRLTEAEGSRLVQARREMLGLPLLIDDVAGQTVRHIQLQLRQMRRKLGSLGLVVIDHLHIVRPEGEDSRHGGTWAVGRVSNALKVLAKTFDCPIIVLAQLNRGVEGREDKRPTMADLRQAGEIEQDADAVGFLYRAEYYLREPERQPGDSDERFAKAMAAYEQAASLQHGRAELILAKVRDGAPGTVALKFDAPTASFSEATP